MAGFTGYDESFGMFRMTPPSNFLPFAKQVWIDILRNYNKASIKVNMSITTLGEGIRNPKQLWLTFFVQKTDNTLIQACRGLCVAGVAFFADFSTLLFCAEILHLHYLSSAAAGFAVGLLVNYLLTVSWIFATRALSSKWMEFAVFCVIGIIGLGLTELVMWLMTGVTGIHYVFSKFFATALVFFWNFFVRKTLLFR